MASRGERGEKRTKAGMAHVVPMENQSDRVLVPCHSPMANLANAGMCVLSGAMMLLNLGVMITNGSHTSYVRVCAIG